jgi:hypothetical protein
VFDSTALWPAHEWDSREKPLPLSGQYVGAAGVIWALDELRKRGHAESSRDLAAAVVRAVELEQASPDFSEDEHYRPGALMSGDTGALLVAFRLTSDPVLADDVHALVYGNVDNPTDDISWGAPGTLLAALAMGEWTGEHKPHCRDPAEHVDVLSVRNEYPQVAVEGGVQVSLGDGHAGDCHRLVFALSIPKLDLLGVAKVADLVIRYVSIGPEVAEHTRTVPVVVNLVSADEAAAAAADFAVTEQVLILLAAQARDQAVALADVGRFQQAQRVIDKTNRRLRKAGLHVEAPHSRTP